MDRAFSKAEIKATSEDRREFEGWASTPTTDRQLDELVPEGAKFELPLPFLLDHDHTKVVGEVYKAEVSTRGIKFWGRIQKIGEPGAAKELVDYAWQLIKNKLRPVVSVGFRPLEWEAIGNGGGRRYTSWEWYELSGVGVAAQPEAKITAAKSAKPAAQVVRLQAPATPVVKLDPVVRASLAGKLKINAQKRWRPGDPIKIVRTTLPVVRLDAATVERMNGPNQPLPVVKLTRVRAKHRVVKLGR